LPPEKKTKPGIGNGFICRRPAALDREFEARAVWCISCGGRVFLVHTARDDPDRVIG